LMVSPVDREAVPIVSIDTDYGVKACPNPADLYVVQDSDDICLVDFTSTSSNPATQFTRIRTFAGLVDWAEGQTDALHREFVKHRLRFHWRDCSGAWEEVERRSDALVEAILAPLGPPPARLGVIRRSSLPYFSVRFLVGRLREKGVWEFLQRAYATLARAGLRKLYGSEVLIKMAADSRSALQ